MKAKVITISVLSLLILGSCKKAEETKATPPPTIPIITVDNKDITGYDEFPVNIEGKVNNEVRAKIQGYITQVYVDEGQVVSAGQPLFRLETNVLSQNANAAKSGISAANAAVSSALAAVNAAQVEVDKLVPLVQKNIISNVQLETAKANLMSAKSNHQQAVAAYEQSKANLSGIQANIDYSVVRSPISGVVGNINSREGSLVGPTDQTPITSVSAVGQVYAYFSMNEAEYLDFLEDTPGKTVKEKLTNLPEVDLILANGKPYSEKGKIQTVTGQIDPLTGSMQFRAVFANADRLLSNGNSGNIRIPKDYKGYLVVPTSATYEQQGYTYVYVSKNDTVKNTMVETVANVNNLTLIESGINKGDKVAVQGLVKLKNGTAIKEQPVSMDSIVNIIKPVM